MTGLKFPDVLGLHVTPVAIASQCARFVATLSVVGVWGPFVSASSSR